MHEPALTLVADLALVLCTAALVTVAFQRLRLPAVLGYLLAGTIIGPHVALTPTVSEESVRTLADLGVILLMFSLGLGFTLEKIAKLAGSAGVVALLEIGLCFTLGFMTAAALGLPPVARVVAGAVACISSTMVVAKTFEEERVRGAVPELVYGVLVFEDLVAILLIAVLTAIAGGGEVSAGEFVGLILRLAAFLVALTLVGLLLVPRAVRQVVRLRREETTVVFAVGLSFAVAILAQFAGFSVALGAFLAGALVAESGSGRIVGQSIRPVRDVFAAIFFVAVGMQVDPLAALRAWPWVLLASVVVVTGKVVGVTIGAFLTGAGVQVAVRGGLSLAQIGEFSFILAGIGMATGAMPPEFLTVVVSTAIVTTALTPFFVRRAEAAARYVDRRLPRPLQTWASLYGSWLEQLGTARPAHRRRGRFGREIRVILLDAVVIAVVVIGTAIFRTRLVAYLQGPLGLGERTVGILLITAIFVVTFPFLVGLLRNGRRLAHRLAEQALAPRPGVDLAASPRRALERTLEVAVVLVVGAPLLAVTLPFVPAYGGAAVLAGIALVGTVAIWRSAKNLEGHVQATAEAVVEALSRQRSHPAEDPLDFVRSTMPGIGEPISHRLPPGSPASGRSLKELNLRGRTGAAVVALVRGEERIAFPGPDTRIEAGDLLALAGTRAAIDQACAMLDSTPTTP